MAGGGVIISLRSIHRAVWLVDKASWLVWTGSKFGSSKSSGQEFANNVRQASKRIDHANRAGKLTGRGIRACLHLENELVSMLWDFGQVLCWWSRNFFLSVVGTRSFFQQVVALFTPALVSTLPQKGRRSTTDPEFKHCQDKRCRKSSPSGPCPARVSFPGPSQVDSRHETS